MTASERSNLPDVKQLLLSVAEVARAFNISQRSVWRLLDEGELERVQTGRAVRITRESVEAFVAKGGAR